MIFSDKQYKLADNAAANILTSAKDAILNTNDIIDQVSDIIKPEPKDQEECRDRIFDILQSFSGVLTADGKCALKSRVFSGAQIKIIPSELELLNGILLVGDRFQPFCAQEVFDDEYQFFVRGSNEPLKGIRFNSAFVKLLPHFMLLGMGNIIDTFMAESDKNRQVLRKITPNKPQIIEVTAFDFSSFYLSTNFRPGDFIIVTIDDPEQCKFTVEYRPYELDARPEDKVNWVRTLEHTIIDIWRNHYNYLDIPEQLSLAFFKTALTGEKLYNHPAVAFTEFLGAMTEITIKKDGVDWMLVPIDETDEPGADSEPEHEQDSCCDHGHHHDHGHAEDPTRGEQRDGAPQSGDPVSGLSASDFSASEGRLDSLDAILADVNAPIGYVELYAFTFDAIANAVDYESFRASILELIDKDFADDAQEVAFLNFLDENWEACTDAYHPGADEPKAPIRARLIELDNARISMTRALLASADTDRLASFTPRIQRLHRGIIDTLALVNNQADLPEDEDEREQFDQRIEDLEDLWDEISSDLDD